MTFDGSVGHWRCFKTNDIKKDLVLSLYHLIRNLLSILLVSGAGDVASGYFPGPDEFRLPARTCMHIFDSTSDKARILCAVETPILVHSPLEPLNLEVWQSIGGWQGATFGRSLGPKSCVLDHAEVRSARMHQSASSSVGLTVAECHVAWFVDNSIELSVFMEPVQPKRRLFGSKSM